VKLKNAVAFLKCFMRLNVSHHLKLHGLIALATAATSMILLRGLEEPRLIVTFSLPPAIAVASTSPQYSARARSIAWGFLVWLGIGAAVAVTPFLFPRMSLFEPRLAQSEGRFLTWFVGTIGFWMGAVIPWNLFTGSIHLQQAGEDVQLSPIARGLGLFAVFVMWLMFLPLMVIKGGLWPVF